MARLALYKRRSSPGEEDKNYSIADQERDIRERWADFPQHTVVREYSDPGGKSYTLARPVFSQLLADAKDGLFEIVVVSRYDRFSRMQDQQAVAIYQLQQYGVRVVSATQPIPDGPMGTLIRNNYAFGAELELYNLRERTYGGKRARVKSGKLPAHSTPTYGYLFKDALRTSYIPDPETAPIMRRIYAMALSGLTTRHIARVLTAERILTPTALWEKRGILQKGREPSEEWSRGTISKMLRNPAYVGRHTGFHRKVEMVERVNPVTHETYEVRRTVSRDVDDPDFVQYDESVCPPLIDEGTFNAVQEIQRRNKEEAARNLREPEALLLRNGFAKCGYCGNNMTGQWARSNKRYRYLCNNMNGSKRCPGKRFSWNAEYLDDIVWRWFVFQFENPEVIRAKHVIWKADRVEGRSIEHDRLGAIEKAIADATRRRKNYLVSVGNAESDEERQEFQGMAHEEHKAIAALTKEHEALTAILARDEQRESAVDLLVSLGEQARESLRHFDFDSKRRALYALKVTVTCWSHSHPDKWIIRWGLSEMQTRALEFLGVDTSVYAYDHHS